MRTLAFDTATRATTVALDAGQGAMLEARDDPPPGERPRHAAKLLPLAARLLEDAGLEFGDVELLVVGVGPGTFTGLRIGIATARGLAQALAIPAVGVSTLQSLALTASDSPDADGRDAIAAVLDARRGEVFAAAWRTHDVEDPERALLAAGAFGPEVLTERLREVGHSVLAVGEGAVEFRTQLERSGASVPDGGAELHKVTAVGHCRIARRLETTPADHIVPDYLRPPDAKQPDFESRARDEQ
jgi:tRNA threonylcarbamoyladenosine biosynthesis protein TsaB